jgi:uncharacterized RDD family membrane protein YckC
VRVDRRTLGSWLSTPGQSPEILAPPQDYRGQRLGLPPSGPGSVAPVGLRVIALLADWFSALILTGFLGVKFGQPEFGLISLLIFAAQVAVLQTLTGSSFGQRLTRIAVVRVDGGQLGLLPLLLRTALICLVIPPVVWDHDTRGLHDRAARTVCVRR